MNTMRLTTGDVPLEFGSTAWFECFARLLLAQVRLAVKPADKVICEVYEQVPAHLGPDDRARLAWTCRITGREAEFTLTECADDEADVKTVGDYAAFRELASFVMREDNAEVFTARVKELVASQRIRSIRQAAAANEAEGQAGKLALHNFVAAMTR